MGKKAVKITPPDVKHVKCPECNHVRGYTVESACIKPTDGYNSFEHRFSNVVAGPFTVASSTKVSVTVADAGWTKDEHAGRWMLIHTEDGKIDRRSRRIRSNSEDTLFLDGYLQLALTRKKVEPPPNDGGRDWEPVAAPSISIAEPTKTPTLHEQNKMICSSCGVLLEVDNP